MDLKEYFAQQCHGSQRRMALKLGVSESYFAQFIKGTVNRSSKRCVQIEQETNGAVTRQDLRPHDYHLIWPELAKKKRKSASDTTIE